MTSRQNQRRLNVAKWEGRGGAPSALASYLILVRTHDTSHTSWWAAIDMRLLVGPYTRKRVGFADRPSMRRVRLFLCLAKRFYLYFDQFTAMPGVQVGVSKMSATIQVLNCSQISGYGPLYSHSTLACVYIDTTLHDRCFVNESWWLDFKNTAKHFPMSTKQLKKRSHITDVASHKVVHLENNLTFLLLDNWGASKNERYKQKKPIGMIIVQVRRSMQTTN
jgi:hypothetical protein